VVDTTPGCFFDQDAFNWLGDGPPQPVLRRLQEQEHLVERGERDGLQRVSSTMKIVALNVQAAFWLFC